MTSWSVNEENGWALRRGVVALSLRFKVEIGVPQPAGALFQFGVIPQKLEHLIHLTEC